MLQVLTARASLVVHDGPTVLRDKPFGAELSQASLAPWGTMSGTREKPLGCVFHTFTLF